MDHLILAAAIHQQSLYIVDCTYQLFIECVRVYPFDGIIWYLVLLIKFLQFKYVLQ